MLFNVNHISDEEIDGWIHKAIILKNINEMNNNPIRPEELREMV